MYAPLNKRGFTLVEILIVLVVIAILVSALSAGILQTMKFARKNKRNTEADALEAAIYAYRFQYKVWPVPDYPDRVYEDNNQLVINKMRPGSEYNPKEIPFLEAGTLRVRDRNTGERLSLRSVWKDGDTAHALVGPYPRSGGDHTDYSEDAEYWLYKITFDYEEETVNVE